jgi:acyl-CoA thioester hydrolase
MYTTPITVRFSDLDIMGHVNNAVYFSYSEHARLEFFEYLGVTKGGFPSVLLARVVCNHHLPVLYGQMVEVQTWVSQIGNKSFGVKHHLLADKQHAATLETVLVWYDHAQKASQSIPQAAREKLKTQMLAP